MKKNIALYKKYWTTVRTIANLKKWISSKSHFQSTYNHTFKLCRRYHGMQDM